MKKKIIIAVVMVLLFAAAVFIVVKENQPEKTEEFTEETAAETEEIIQPEEQSAEEETETEKTEIERIDYDALYAAYSPETIVGTIDGREVTWEEYYGWLSYNIAQIESTMDAYRTYYGMNYNWSDDSGTGDGSTLAEIIPDEIEENIIGKYAIESMVEESGKELSEENLANIAAQKESDKEYCCGEGATDEDFEEYLKELHLTQSVYEYMCAYSEYQSILMTYLFGENLEKIDEDVINTYIEDNGYLNVNHILFLTTDMSSGEELTDEEKTEKRAKAEELLAELKKIKDQDELVKRFKELKNQYCEDTGKTSYPDGYVFTEGTMVEEFEEAAKLLEAYGISDIVESTYGYHILLRLPLDGDTVVEENEGEDPDTIKSLAAEEKYTEALTEKAEMLELIKSDGFSLNLADYIVITEE